MAFDNTLLIEGADIRWKNFEGRRDMYNDSGKRQFVLMLDEQTANEKTAEGWPVKVIPPRDEGDTPSYFVRVKVKMDGRKPATLVLITHKGRTPLDETTAMLLDHAWLKTVDLVVRAYNYDYNGRKGTSIYLNSGYFTLEENPREVHLEEKYADIPLALAEEQLEEELNGTEEPPF